MLKILMVIFSYFIGQITGDKPKGFSIDEIVNSVIERIRDLFGAILFGLAGLFLSLVGFISAYFNILSEFDKSGTVGFSAVTGGGLFLLFLGVILIFVSGRMTKGTPKPKPVEPQARSSNIEQAISMLIMEFVKEREEKRSKKGLDAKTE